MGREDTFDYPGGRLGRAERPIEPGEGAVQRLAVALRALRAQAGNPTANPDLGWSTTSVLDLLPDGSTVGWEHADPPGGRLTSRFILEYFRTNSYRLPIHPATLCIQRDLALGGWMALPGGEDTGLLLAAAAVRDGYFISQPGLLYRKHAEQSTAQAAWARTPEWEARMRLIEERAEVLRRRGRARNRRLKPVGCAGRGTFVLSCRP